MVNFFGELSLEFGRPCDTHDEGGCNFAFPPRREYAPVAKFARVASRAGSFCSIFQEQLRRLPSRLTLHRPPNTRHLDSLHNVWALSTTDNLCAQNTMQKPLLIGLNHRCFESLWRGSVQVSSRGASWVESLNELSGITFVFPCLYAYYYSHPLRVMFMMPVVRLVMSSSILWHKGMNIYMIFYRLSLYSLSA